MTSFLRDLGVLRGYKEGGGGFDPRGNALALREDTEPELLVRTSGQSPFGCDQPTKWGEASSPSIFSTWRFEVELR